MSPLYVSKHYIGASLFSVKPSTAVLVTTPPLVDLVGHKGTKLTTTAAATLSHTSSIIAASPSMITITTTRTQALSTVTATPTMITDTIEIPLLPTAIAMSTTIVTPTQLLAITTTTLTITETSETPQLSATNTTLSKVLPSSSLLSFPSITSTLTTKMTSATENIGTWKGLLSTNQPSSAAKSSMFAFRKQMTISLAMVPTDVPHSEANIIHQTTDTSPVSKS